MYTLTSEIGFKSSSSSSFRVLYLWITDSMLTKRNHKLTFKFISCGELKYRYEEEQRWRIKMWRLFWSKKEKEGEPSACKFILFARAGEDNESKFGIAENRELFSLFNKSLPPLGEGHLSARWIIDPSYHNLPSTHLRVSSPIPWHLNSFIYTLK